MKSDALRRRTAEDLRLLRDNRDAVREQNYQNMTRLLTIVVVMTLLLSVWCLLVRRQYRAGAGYAVIFVMCSALYLGRNSRALTGHPLLGLYFESVVFMSFAIFLSVFNAPDQKASVLLGLFCIIPLILIDMPWRVDVMLAGFLCLHTVLAFILKSPQIAGIDTVNSIGFFFLGANFGNSSMRARLSEIDLRRRSEIEKRVDVLTGILNRRSLFEQLAVFERPGAERPAGVLMFDIDEYKRFNDTFGHAAGDECLRRLGSVLLGLERERRIVFYRYGGDEFAGFAYVGGRAELLDTAELLKERACGISVDGSILTVSIGAVCCGDGSVSNYERLIDCADRQLYAAKARGRNSVCVMDYEPGDGA